MPEKADPKVSHSGMPAPSIPLNFELDMVTIKKRKTKDGGEHRYELRYRFNDKRWYVTAEKGSLLSSAKDARRLAAVIEHEIKDNTHNPLKYQKASNKLWLFKTQIQIWLDGKMQILKPQTTATYKFLIDRHILPFFADFDLSEIKAIHGVTFLNSLPSTLSPYTKKHIIDILKIFFNHCSKNDIIVKPPVMPSIKIAERAIRWADYETQDKILAAIPPLHQPIFHFAMRHGMRIGEVIGLLKKDIDFKLNAINIQRSHGRFGATSTKTGKVRTIPLHPEMIESITALCSLKLPDAFLFTHHDQPYNDNIFSKIARKATKKVGIKISAYELVRHSVISQAAVREVNPIALQKYAGHTHISTTQKYMNLDSLSLASIQTLNPISKLQKGQKKEEPGANEGQSIPNALIK